MLDTNQRIIAFQELVNVANDSFLVDINLVIDYLNNLGYFDAPASTKYHLAYSGGLFEHSLSVTKELLLLTKNEKLIWQKKDSPILIGLFHDLCKADAYIRNPMTGGYMYNTAQKVQGHGDKSIMYLDNMSDKGLIRPITDEERLCIRWHMGAFDDKTNWTYYTDAIHKFPNVLWTHTADLVSAHIREL